MCQAGQTGGGWQHAAEPLTMYRVAPEPRITQSREAGKPAIKEFLLLVVGRPFGLTVHKKNDMEAYY